MTNRRGTYNATKAGKGAHYQQGNDLVYCPLVEVSLNKHNIYCFSSSSDQTIDVGEGE